MKFTLPPANRIVAFAGPYISLVTGAASAWLVLKVHLIGELGIAQTALSTALTGGITATIGAVIPHLGFQKWLDGHQKFSSSVFDLIQTLDPGMQSQIAAALPIVNGDALKALQKVLTPLLAGATSTGVAAALTPAVDVAGDGSGDADDLTVDPHGVTAVAPDDIPTEFGNDQVHAPPPPAAADAGGAQAGGA